MQVLIAALRDPAWASISVFVSVIALLVTTIISIKALPKDNKGKQTELVDNISSSASINRPRRTKSSNSISPSSLPQIKPHQPKSYVQVSHPSFISALNDPSTKISYSIFGSIIILIIWNSITHYFASIYGLDYDKAINTYSQNFDAFMFFSGKGGLFYWITNEIIYYLIILYNYIIWTNVLFTNTSKMRAIVGTFLFVIIYMGEYYLVFSLKILNNILPWSILHFILSALCIFILYLTKFSKDKVN